MDAILDFLADNYVYFIIISGVLLVALIGLLAKEKARKKKDVSTLASAGQISKQAEELQAAEVGGSQSNENDGPLGMQDETQSVGDTLVIPDPSANEEQPQNNEPTLVIPDPTAPTEETQNNGPTLVIPDPSASQPSMDMTEQMSTMNQGMMSSQPMMNQQMPQPQMMNQGMMGGQMMGQPQMMNQQMYMDPNQMNNMNQGM